jgi:hypothetical protein
MIARLPKIAEEHSLALFAWSKNNQVLLSGLRERAASSLHGR